MVDVDFDSAKSAFELRREFGNWGRYDDERVVFKPYVGEWATYGNWMVVGNGKVTNGLCGKFRGHWGCLNVYGHEGKEWRGEDCTNKGYFRVVHYSCKKPSCPLCYESWCASQANVIAQRLAEGSKRFGLVEHLSASVPLKLYNADFKVIHKAVISALEKRGIIGGCLIIHMFRWDRFKHWYWSPHFHVLGFVLGGYGRCRNCKDQKCIGYGNYNLCDGFEARTRKCFEEDGFIVKVAVDKFGEKSERRSVFRTAQYILSHSSIRTDVKRPHAYTYFGVCAYRKLKVTVEKRKSLCPICNRELGKVRYKRPAGLDDFGHQRFVVDRDDSRFKRDFLDIVSLDKFRRAWVEDGGSAYNGF